MSVIKDFVIKLFKITPAVERDIEIKEPFSLKANIIKNQVIYRGDPSELDQFFNQCRYDNVSKGRFWGCETNDQIRKIHSGIPQIVIDRFKDIILADYDGCSFGEEGEKQPIKDLWEEIAKDNDFEEILGEAIQGSLSSGDGAFKVSIDTKTSKYPILEYYTGDSVEFVRRRGRIVEVIFYKYYKTPGTFSDKQLILKEIYGKGYVKYELVDEKGKVYELSIIPELAKLKDVTYKDKFIMAVPLIFYRHPKWKGRGKPLFDTKTDDIDALDEVISQWLDAVRSGRVKRYLPEDLVPRNPENGQQLRPNPFDNQFVIVQHSLIEGADQKIDVSQPDIAYESYVSSYAGFLDLVLQGIISPSTLGIDLKKTDNAESQREKEKVTLYTRGQLIKVLIKILPQLVEVLMMTNNTMHDNAAGDYTVTAKFGEYAEPSFTEKIETVGKAKAYGVMSTEKVVDELYGDKMKEEDKNTEIARIKAESGISIEEPNMQNSVKDKKDIDDK